MNNYNNGSVLRMKERIVGLIEQTKSHVVILLLFRLFLGSRSCGGLSSRSSPTSSSWSSCTTTSTRHGAKLAKTLSYHLIDGLARKLRYNNTNFLGIRLYSNRPENLADVVCGDVIATKSGEKSSSHVTHFKS